MNEHADKAFRNLKAAIVTALFIILAEGAFAQDIPFDNQAPTNQAGSTSETPPPPPVQDAVKSDSAEYPSENPNALPAPKDVSRSMKAPADEFSSPTPPPPIQTNQRAAPVAKRGSQTPADIAVLGKLAPFDDIAVIQRRYLPKTHRFELFPNIGFVINDAFFTDFAYGARLAYSFNETWGLEAVGFGVSSNPNSVTNELSSVRSVATSALATPQAYYGADVRWSPIYGKIGWLNRSIIPFDFYFEAGGGFTTTNQSTSPATFHLGGGQLFAISQSVAFRWDISWFGYNTTTTVSNNPSGFYNNLYAMIGVSFFFPGAEYR